MLMPLPIYLLWSEQCCGTAYTLQHVPTLNILQRCNIDRREEMILFFSRQRWVCAESEVSHIGRREREREKAGAMKPAVHNPYALSLHPVPCFTCCHLHWFWLARELMVYEKKAECSLKGRNGTSCFFLHNNSPNLSVPGLFGLNGSHYIVFSLKHHLQLSWPDPLVLMTWRLSADFCRFPISLATF